MTQALPRKTLTIFGKTGGTSNFGQFGSQAASAPLETKDVATIQALTAWVDGWQDAVALGEAPYLQDMNGVMYVHSYEMAYVLTEGIPEWDSGTTYSKGCVVKLPYTGTNNFQLFVSLVDSNTNQALPTAPASNANWQFVQGFVSGTFRFGQGIGFGDYSSEGIIGTATNDDAAAGYVGQYVHSVVNTTFPSSGSWGDATSISLTAGDWDLDAVGNQLYEGGTYHEWDFGIGTVSGNNQPSAGNFVAAPGAISTSNLGASISGVRLSLASTTTVYLKFVATYSGTAPNLDGRISARRVR